MEPCVILRVMTPAPEETNVYSDLYVSRAVGAEDLQNP
jgi:hypothetical protein